MQNDTYRIHILGPDDIHDKPDELTALRECNEINVELAALRAKEKFPTWCMAVVEKNGVEYSDAATQN
jgi:hypothetical protein